jgi:hypothetical protein
MDETTCSNHGASALCTSSRCNALHLAAGAPLARARLARYATARTGEVAPRPEPTFGQGSIEIGCTVVSIREQRGRDLTCRLIRQGSGCFYAWRAMPRASNSRRERRCSLGGAPSYPSSRPQGIIYRVLLCAGGAGRWPTRLCFQ